MWIIASLITIYAHNLTQKVTYINDLIHSMHINKSDDKLIYFIYDKFDIPYRHLIIYIYMHIYFLYNLLVISYYYLIYDKLN